MLKTLAITLALIWAAPGHTQSPPAQAGTETHAKQGDKRADSGHGHANSGPSPLLPAIAENHAASSTSAGPAALGLQVERSAPAAISQGAKGVETAEIDQKSKQQGAWSWGVLEWSALATAGATLALAIITWLMWRVSRDTAHIARTALQAGRDQNRAYLFATELQLVFLSLGNGPNEISVLIRNYGATPAVLKAISWEVSDVPGAHFDDGGFGSFVTHVIGSGDAIKLGTTLHLPNTSGQQVHEGGRSLILECRCAFTDFAGVEHLRVDAFAFLVEPYGFHLVHGEET